MSKEEALQLINNSNINENLKNELITEINSNGVTEELVEKVKSLIEDAKSDVKTLDEITEMTKKAQNDINESQEAASDQINQITTDSEEQLDRLDKEADKADSMFQTLTNDMEEKKKEDIRDEINS